MIRWAFLNRRKVSGDLSAVALGAMALLGGCDRSSPDYEALQKLPPDQWGHFAVELPIERQLDLHLAVQRSSHNPPQTITEAFGAKPDETYRALVNRLEEGDDSRYYQGIFYEIDRSATFSICDQPDRAIVQKYLWSIA